MKKVIKISIIFFIWIALVLLYSRYIATSGLIVKEIPIKAQIPKEFNGLKVVHLSDLHYGRILNQKELNNLVKQINLINPDIVVFTGDLIDRDAKITDYNILTESMTKIEAKAGKYAILGNHDYDYGENKVLEILENSNFKVLRNRTETIYNKNSSFLISGIDDVIHKKAQTEFMKEEDIYQIVLVHEPDYAKEIIQKKGIDMILSGHSHNGQIRIPFIGAIYHVKGAKTYYDEHYTLGNTELYISGGIGVSGFNFRLFNRPSINFYRIYNK